MRPRSAVPWVVLGASLLGSSPIAAQGAPSIAHQSMQVWWRADGALLHLTVRGATRGWVAIGLNSRAGLDGSLLIMGAAQGETSIVEEHIARPPVHPRRIELGGTPSLRHAIAIEDRAATTVHATVDSSVRDGIGPALVPGQPVHVTLAWSTHDDFGHHSAERFELTAVLPR